MSDKFINRWVKIKQKGFARYLIIVSIVWTLVMWPIIKYVLYILEKIDHIQLANLWWEIPSYLGSGATFGICAWIINNYRYASLTGDFTHDDHDH